MITLKARLNIGLGVILAAGFGLQWALRSEALPIITETQMVSRLDADIESIRESLSTDENGELHVDGNLLPLYRNLHSGHYYLIETPHKKLYSPSLGDDSLPKIVLDEGKPKRWHTTGPDREPLLMFTRGLDLAGEPLQISVGEDLTDLKRHSTEIGSLVLMLNGATIFLALILQWIFVRNALRPFTFLRKELADMAATNDFEPATAAEELMRIQEIRQLLELIQQRIDRSRHAIGNLAHALKNPLTVLLRLIQDPSISNDPAVRDHLEQQTQTILDIVEGELRRARMSGIGLIAQPFDLKTEVEALAKAVSSIYNTRELDFHLTLPDRSVPFDRHDFMELLGNLVDNAAKWARRSIAIDVTMIGNELMIVVEDDGPGCDEQTMERLMQRGARLDETIGGHGLGLSIVKSLIEQYGGVIQFSKSKQLGGLRVEAILKLQHWMLRS
jgi:signal transduction histidine kinase